MNMQMKRIIQFAAAGSVSLLIGSSTLAGLLHKSDEDERCQINPACHPTYGYHQTCWRRFPPLPPCDTCPTCQLGMPATACPDGNCQPMAPHQPQPDMLHQPPTVPPEPQPETIDLPETTSRYSAPQSMVPGESGRYGTSRTAAPWSSQHTMAPVPGQGLGQSGIAQPSVAEPQTMPSLQSGGGRYQTGPGYSTVAPALPASPTVPPRPAPAPVESPSNGPADLPPIPGTAPRSSSLTIPAQSMVLPGGGRYGRMSATIRPAANPSAAVQAPVRPATRTTPTINHRYPIRPQREAATQLLTAPLLRLPAQQTQ